MDKNKVDSTTELIMSWELAAISASLLKDYLIDYFLFYYIPQSPEELKTALYRDYLSYSESWAKENKVHPVSFSAYLEELEQIYTTLTEQLRNNFSISIKTMMEVPIVAFTAYCNYAQCANYIKSEALKSRITTKPEKTKHLKNAQQRVELLKQIGFFNLDFVKLLDKKKKEKLLSAITQTDLRTIIGILNDEGKYLIKNYDSEQVSDFIKKEL